MELWWKKQRKEEILEDFSLILEPVLANEWVQQMRNFNQHGDTSCFAHSYRVSRYSYRVCRFLGLDSESAARGAMLHDFFLYSWKQEDMKGSEHLWFHPMVALETAEREFELNDKEKDIIVKHMWPVTHELPDYAESLIVSTMDKYSAVLEAGNYMIRKMNHMRYKYSTLMVKCIRNRTPNLDLY